MLYFFSGCVRSLCIADIQRCRNEDRFLVVNQSINHSINQREICRAPLYDSSCRSASNSCIKARSKSTFLSRFRKVLVSVCREGRTEECSRRLDRSGACRYTPKYAILTFKNQKFCTPPPSAPSALRFSRLRRSTSRAFGARPSPPKPENQTPPMGIARAIPCRETSRRR